MGSNALALAKLDAHIARIRALPELVRQVAPEVAQEVERELVANIARGVAPDGTPWPLTKTGAAPLTGAAKALNVRAVGTVILVTVSGPEAKHHKGTARGGIKRQIIPTRKIPDPMVNAIRAVFSRRFAAHMTGAT